MSKQKFFDGANTDDLLRVILLLAGELHVTRDRLRAIEAVLDEAGIVSDEKLQQVVLTPRQQAQAAADRASLVAALHAIVPEVSA